MHSSKAKRLHFLDNARGFIIALVVLQHATQAYAYVWGGDLWFVPTTDRDTFFDAIFMTTDSFIMQTLFLISGMFILPSLERRGWWSFTVEKMVRLVIPCFLGIIIIVPMLAYPRHLITAQNPLSYLDFWANIFFPHELQGGGFWFLILLSALTFATAIIHTTMPFLLNWLSQLAKGMVKNPLYGFLVLGGVGAILIGVSDLAWGAKWWIGFWKVFFARANMLLSFIFYFFIGVGLQYSGVLKDEKLLEKLSHSWLQWSVIASILAVLYISFSLSYLYDGAFSDEVRYYFMKGGSWAQAWPIIFDEAPLVLVRTTLHGFFCAAITIAILATLRCFTESQPPLWTSLAACSYGIYFFHEPFVVWVQYGLLDSTLPPTIKLLFAFTIGLVASWAFTDRILRRMPVTKKVF